MLEEEFIKKFHQVYPKAFVIVSPPRCSSTALARVFWEYPSIGYYAHEPFEPLYYLQEDLAHVWEVMQNPLDLKPVKANQQANTGQALLIKEMPYQVGDHFELLARLATAPIVFIIRDPRLNITSRIKKKLEVGDSPRFPFIETGWQLLESQISLCQNNGIEHYLVDSTEFRNQPAVILKALFSRMNLTFSESLLSWKSQTEIDIDNLDGKHSHLYDKVLRSSRLVPDEEPIPALDTFPEEDGVRQHVMECLSIYEKLRQHPNLITTNK